MSSEGMDAPPASVLLAMYFGSERVWSCCRLGVLGMRGTMSLPTDFCTFLRHAGSQVINEEVDARSAGPRGPESTHLVIYKHPTIETVGFFNPVAPYFAFSRFTSRSCLRLDHPPPSVQSSQPTSPFSASDGLSDCFVNLCFAPFPQPPLEEKAPTGSIIEDPSRVILLYGSPIRSEFLEGCFLFDSEGSTVQADDAARELSASNARFERVMRLIIQFIPGLNTKGKRHDTKRGLLSMPGAHGMEGTEDCAFVDMGAFPGVSPKLGAVGRSWLSCELPPTIIWRQGHWGVEIPAYTVALPRPPKPPLSSETLERNRRIKTPRGRVHLLTRKIYYRGNRFTQSAAAMTEIQSTIPEWLDSQAFLPNDFFADHENVHLTPSPLSNDGSRPSVSTSPIPAKRRLSSTLDSGEKAVSRKSKIQKVRQPKGRPRTSSNPSSPSSTSTETDRFACPFYKRYGRKMCQETPQNWHKNCIVGREISRIKEHVLRNHLRKDYECNRCFDTFKTREQLTSHQRSPGCRLKPKDDKALILKIDRARFEQLRKKPPGESPEDYWREVYRIIFELDRTADVPSPYNEDDFRRLGREVAKLECDLPDGNGKGVLRMLLELMDKFGEQNKLSQEDVKAAMTQHLQSPILSSENMTSTQVYLKPHPDVQVPDRFSECVISPPGGPSISAPDIEGSSAAPWGPMGLDFSSGNSL